MRKVGDAEPGLHASVREVRRPRSTMRAGRDGTTRTLASGAPLDFPATVAYRGNQLFATNFALKNASAGKPAAPGLIRF